MILFFKTPQKSVIATEANHPLNEQEVKELSWLYGDAEPVEGRDADRLLCRSPS